MTKKQGLKLIAKAKNSYGINSGFTIVELLIVIAIMSLLASTATALYTNYTLRSKTAEAPIALAKMVEGEVRYYTQNNSFLDAGPTNIPPSSVKVGWTSSDEWMNIGFSFSGPILFGYQASATAANAIDCMAMGDLNGDGNTSLFRRSISVDSGSTLATGLYVFDELE